MLLDVTLRVREVHQNEFFEKCIFRVDERFLVTLSTARRVHFSSALEVLCSIFFRLMSMQFYRKHDRFSALACRRSR